MLALASALSDHDLLARIGVLAGKEREATVELVAHLAALDARPSLYAAEGHGSLFGYCTEVLRLSEDAACNRIYAARACRRFPGDPRPARLRRGVAHLRPDAASAPHAREPRGGPGARPPAGAGATIEALIAELAPRPDVPTSVRKLPEPATPAHAGHRSEAHLDRRSAPPDAGILPPPHRPRAPVIETTSPERYRVQFTIGKESHDTLRRLQAPPAPRDPERRSRRHRRARPEPAPREGREDEVRRDVQAAPPIRPGTDTARLPDEARTPVSVARHPERRPARGLATRRRPVRASSARTASGAPSARSWSSTTSSPTPWADRPPSRTSRCAAGATINTRRSWSSGGAHRREFVSQSTVSRAQPGPDGPSPEMARQWGAMRVRLLVLAILVLAGRAPAPVVRAQASTRSAALSAALRESPGASHKVWVYFRDKGPDPAARLDATSLSPRARARRALRGSTKASPSRTCLSCRPTSPR